MKSSRAWIINILAIVAVLLLYLLFVFLPVLRDQREKISRQYASEMQLKSVLIENAIARSIEGTRSITSRSMIRNRLRDYREGLISFEMLREYTASKYLDGVGALENCVFAERLVDSIAVVTYGTDVRRNWTPAACDSIGLEIVATIPRLPETDMINVISPVTFNGVVLGHDCATFTLQPVVEQVSEEGLSVVLSGGYPYGESDTVFQSRDTIHCIFISQLIPATFSFSTPGNILYKDLSYFFWSQLAVLVMLLLLLIISQLAVRRIFSRREQDLESIIATRTQDLEGLNATKDRMLSIIGHDLRSPFNGILGFLRVAAEHLEEGNDSEARKSLRIAENSSIEALDLLNNLLCWARSQAKDPRFLPEHFDLQETIERVLEQAGPQAQLKGIMLRNNVIEGAMAYGDVDMVKTILRNLVVNAIKFTDRGGHVEIRSESNAKGRQISVSDSGRGMSPDKLSQIMVKATLDSSIGTENEPGSGLGLVLCRDFVDRHGGEIRAESKVGEGTVFFITLPSFQS